MWDFSQNIKQVMLELGNADHYAFSSQTLFYQYNTQGWQAATTDATGNISLVFDGSSNQLMFKASGNKYNDQFYLRNATISTVPLPAALILLLSALLLLSPTIRKNRLTAI